MKLSWVWMLAILLSEIFNFRASANGGPVAWTGGTASGDISPRQEGSVRLKSEELSIVLKPDLQHFDVDAKYQLTNPGLKRKVKYGVPILWVSEEGEEGMTLKNRTVEGNKASRTVQIAVGEKQYGCSFVSEKKDVVGYVTGAESSQIGWCVADLEIPPENVQLSLKYESELIYDDYEYSKSALTSFSNRKLVYPLFPAGYWSGVPDSVSVSLDPGPFKSSSPPSKAKVENGVWKWALKNPDLKKTKNLELEFGKSPLVSRQLMAWNKNGSNRIDYEVKASSFTPSSSGNTYGPENLLDGRGDTAWCVRTKKKGVGEWVELHAKSGPKALYCTFEGIAIVPGYAKSESIFHANNRVKSVKVTKCDEPLIGGTHELEATKFDEAAQFIPLGYGTTMDKHQRCIKIEITGIVPGEDFDDTCVSEISAVVNCG